jgi:PAS domain S-box-containing protein
VTGPALDDARAIDAAVRRGLADRVLAGLGPALVAHLVLAGAVAVLLFGVAPPGLLAGWVGSVLVATAVRAGMLGPLRRRADPASAVRAVRLLLAAAGLAWGVGAAMTFPEVPFTYVALILVVLSGLVAGAAATLVADPATFQTFLVTSLIAAPAGVLAHGPDRPQWIVVFLLLFFGVFMVTVNRRAHAALRQQLRATALLAVREQEAARERAFLDALIASSPVAIAVLNRDGRIRHVNPGFESLFGYAAADTVGRELDDLVVPDDDRGASRTLEAKVRAGGIVSAEVERRTKDGRRVPATLRAAVVPEAVGGGLVAVYQDMTERRQVENALREARDLAEHAASARAAFLANMSHEIRTPMNAVLGFVELILDTELSSEQRRALELVRSSSEALITILNDVLDYSKIEGEHLRLESIPFDLPKLVHSTVSLLAVRAREKHLELVAEVPRELPQMVRGDPTRLRQVLTNLIGNAVKFTDEGEVLVAVRAEDGPGDGTRVHVSVRDTGIGIAPEHLGAIFAEFTQADASTTRRYGGTGLGLAIARRLVALMGGELTVASELGRGSEFRFSVALAREPVPPRLAPVPSLGGWRVLIVDDNESNRRLLRDMLAAEGLAVTEAPSADAGLEALRRAPCDLAILDAQMPGRDGFELAAAIRATPALAATRLVMLTSAGRRGDAERCRELGIHGYLTKPIARADLLEAVSVVLASRPEPQPDVITRHLLAERRRPLRVLLAEDNPVNQQVAAAMLLKRGHTVDVVSNGREAVAAVRDAAVPYDVILMDVQMPEMDGFQATAAIRALPAGGDLPIVALTAHALSGERERCLARGMTGYLAKPFKPHELYGAVEGRDGGGAVAAAPGGAGPTVATADDAVDVEGFRRSMREAGAEAAVDTILRTFAEHADARFAAIVKAVAATDVPGTGAAAHAFRSAAATIGAHRLATQLADLEAEARAGRPAEAAALERIELEVAAVVAALQRA